MSFIIDSRISNSSFFLCHWPLSDLLLKNDSNFPWLVLIPRVPQVQELHELDQHCQKQLLEEVSQASQLCKAFFEADKINIGMLGNIVPQLHIHVVARYQTDALWPQGIWQANATSAPYPEKKAASLCRQLKDRLSTLAML